MEGWRRQGDNFNQEGTRTTRPHYKRPSFGSWQQTVPAWEKKFCTSVGSVSWRKILETKKCMHLYDNIVQWNDSAGAEAFQNAKNRFYANFHGLSCDISMPDPNLYIDEIDWDSKIDPDLISALKSRYVVSDVENNEKVVIFGNALTANQGFSSSGWGDNEDDVKKPPNPTTEDNAVQGESNQGQDNGPTKGNGRGDYEYNKNTWFNTDNRGAKVDSGWDDNWNNGWEDNWNNEWGDNWNNGWRDNWNNEWGYDQNNYCGWNQYGNSNYVIDNVTGSIDGVWQKMSNSRGKGSARYMSRYRTSRFRGADNQGNHYSWRNGNGSKHMNTTNVPVHRASGQVAHQWN